MRLSSLRRPRIHSIFNVENQNGLSSLLASDRRTLHGRVADRIEGARPGAVGVIARHRAAAGDAERAIPLLIRAAELARGLGAAAEAAAWYTAAADLVGGVPGADLRARASEAEADIPAVSR